MPKIDDMYMTDCQCLKKQLITEGMDEETAHLSVYGILLYNNVNKIIDDEISHPECYDESKSSIKKNHKIREKLKEIKKDVSTSIKQLGIKTGEISDESIRLSIESSSAVITMASSPSIFPPGSGLPVAFSAVLSIFSSLQSFQTKIVQILTILKPLKYISILLPESKIPLITDPTINAIKIINGSLTTTNATVKTITSLKSTLMGSSSSSPSIPPGIGNKPFDPIKLNITADQSTINVGESSKIGVVATKGSWEYTYSWGILNSQTFHSDKKQIRVSPIITTTYTIKVTDSKGNSKKGQITIIVANLP